MGTSDPSAFEKIEQSSIDLFKLKVFALLMCRGKSEHKGDILVDMILGNNLKEKSKNDLVNWHQPRLKAVIKNLIYFSEIFPKKYMKNFVSPSGGTVESILSDRSKNNKRTSSMKNNKISQGD